LAIQNSFYGVFVASSVKSGTALLTERVAGKSVASFHYFGGQGFEFSCFAI